MLSGWLSSQINFSLIFQQNECRMFRVQFGGDSEEQMLEHCCSCVQKLAEFVPVHEADELSQNLCYSRSQVEDTDQSTSVLRAVSRAVLGGSDRSWLSYSCFLNLPEKG